MNPITAPGPSSVLPNRSAQINGHSNLDTERQAELRKVAVELEAAFLTEMLKSAGFGKSRDSYGGGAGEDQFNSILVRAQAEQMARAGGIGLAESLYRSLLETEK